MPKVYITQQAPAHLDLTEAKAYGDIVPIFTGNLFPDNANELMSSKYDKALRVLEKFDPNNDMIGLVGAPLFAAATGFILGRHLQRPVRMLRWDRVLKGYYEIKVGK